MQLADEVVDAAQPVATLDRPFLADAVGTGGVEAHHVIRTLCAMRDWDDVALLAEAAADGISARTDHQGFTFLDDGTVLVFDALDVSVGLSRKAFMSLLRRLLDVLVEAVSATGDHVPAGPDWERVLAARRRLASTEKS